MSDEPVEQDEAETEYVPTRGTLAHQDEQDPDQREAESEE